MNRTVIGTNVSTSQDFNTLTLTLESQKSKLNEGTCGVGSALQNRLQKARLSFI